MTGSAEGGILTLEPLIEAVRAGVEGVGWELSGLQKTTSHQFEGRWEGDSTRSAYLFFHPRRGPEHVSIDVYLDETTRGLTGNMALVVDLVSLKDLGNATHALRDLSTLSARALGDGSRRPVTLRLRLADAAREAGEAETEVRFKHRIPSATIRRGTEAVSALAVDTVLAFQQILASTELATFAHGD